VEEGSIGFETLRGEGCVEDGDDGGVEVSAEYHYRRETAAGSCKKATTLLVAYIYVLCTHAHTHIHTYIYTHTFIYTYIYD
jgi:hypothetical protein